MTQTDRLRAMLDERGVECVTDDGEYVKSTTWYGVGDKRATFVEYSNGECRFAMDDYNFTPEQAIAATLGAGTCKVVASDHDGQMWVYRHEFSCDCGQRNYFTASSEPPKYCPNCGAKVVSE